MSLINAILAMDSYHSNHPGGLFQIIYGSESKQLATAIDGFQQVSASKDIDAKNFGFSATAYARGSETIIAYRGTDDGVVKSIVPGRPVKVVRRLDDGRADVALLADMLPATVGAG